MVANDGDHAFLIALRDGGHAALAAETHFAALTRALDIHRAFRRVAHHRGAGLDFQISEQKGSSTEKQNKEKQAGTTHDQGPPQGCKRPAAHFSETRREGTVIRKSA